MVVFIAVARTPIRTSNHAKRTNIGAAWHSTFRGNMMSKGGSMTAVEVGRRKGAFVQLERERNR